ncbi:MULTISPECIES: TetR/AcrR family transcriptional regulator [Bacillales]|uniref:TetR/AcrR family transcriptional regulator n=1 Tax=Bacillales TaxID=1385 RepID=UPI0006A76EDF|nr:MULTISPECIES: TetR/AcrR family transcriptional regulator [Bacillales]
MEQSSDRRIIRTKQFITEAFLALLQEKSFKEIVIKEITERANVNRSTFYAYYSDKDDLLIKMVEGKLTELNAIFTEDKAGRLEAYLPRFDSSDPFFIALFDHLEANETFYRVLLTKLDPAASSYYSDKMIAVIRDAFYWRISNIPMDYKQAVPQDLLLDYVSFSTFHLAKKWLEQRMVYSSRHMALQLTRLSFLGSYQAMGLLD